MYSWKNKTKNLNQRLHFTYPKASIKDAQVTKKAFSSQKRTSSTSKHEISKFFLLLWVIMPSWILIRNPNTDPDPKPWLLMRQYSGLAHRCSHAKIGDTECSAPITYTLFYADFFVFFTAPGASVLHYVVLHHHSQYTDDVALLSAEVFKEWHN
jgi:hypothetical protein